ncbi:MAG: hypothetical protein HQL65_19940, partial [Magnetococcales bacterium]|nr:hypothetical protein [Magnetococcales bacterium]
MRLSLTRHMDLGLFQEVNVTNLSRRLMMKNVRARFLGLAAGLALGLMVFGDGLAQEAPVSGDNPVGIGNQVQGSGDSGMTGGPGGPGMMGGPGGPGMMGGPGGPGMM